MHVEYQEVSMLHSRISSSLKKDDVHEHATGSPLFLQQTFQKDTSRDISTKQIAWGRNVFFKENSL